MLIKQLYQQALQQCTQPLPLGYLPFYVQHLAVGFISPKAVQALLDTDLLQVFPDKAVLQRNDRSTWDLVARTLYQAQLLRGWRDELVDVWYANQSIAGIERTATRPLGLRTQAVHLHACTTDGRIWLGQRSLHKHTDPGKWDTAAGGLVSYREDLSTAFYRESFEEAGLKASDLQGHSDIYNVRRFYRQLPEGYQIEEMLVAKCTLPDHITPCNQDGEVDHFQAFTRQEVLELIAQGMVSLEATIILLHDFLHSDHV